MLKNIKKNALTHFIADVFMCEQCHIENKLSYWNLRLLNKGKLIDAYHWGISIEPMIHYQNKDGILVLSRWTNQRKERIQILQSRIITRFAANDDIFDQTKPVQLEFDFGDDYLLNEAPR